MGLKKRVRELERALAEALQIIEELKEKVEENIQLRKRVQELEKKLKENSKPKFVKEDIKKKKKKTGQKKGHKGHRRYSPGRIDEIKEHSCEECSECGGRNLSEVQEIRERTTTDLPEKQEVINTKHLIERKYCKDCKKMVEARVPDALPNAQFGLRLMIFVVYLKITMRLPSNKVTELLDITYNLKISDGEVYKMLEQMSEAYGAYYEKLKQKIIDAKVKNIDETGHRIDGINHWLWIFINKEVALYEVSRRRNSDVPSEILGNQEGKFFGSDRHVLYNKFKEKTGAKQQICETHLLRNSKDLADNYPEAKYIHKRLKTIFKKAKEGKTSKEQLLRWVDRIATSRIYTSKEVYKFAKSIFRNHRDDLFRFIDNPEIESTNNIAERGLRHAVIMRKISNGNRSQKGADITKRLLSVTETIKLNYSNPLTAMSNVLQISK
jgi:transposase